MTDTFWLDDPKCLFSTVDQAQMIVPTPYMSLTERLNALTRLCIYIFIIVFIVTDDSDSDVLLYVPILIIAIMVFIWMIHRPKLSQFHYHGVGGPRTTTVTEGVGVSDQSRSINRPQRSPMHVSERPVDGDHHTETTTDHDQRRNDDEHRHAPITPTYRKPTYNNPLMNHRQSDYDVSSDRLPETLSLKACDWTAVKDDISEQYYANMYRNSMDLYDRESGERSFYTMPATTVPNDRESFQKWCYRPPSVFKESGDNAVIHVDTQYDKRPPATSYII